MDCFNTDYRAAVLSDANIYRLFLEQILKQSILHPDEIIRIQKQRQQLLEAERYNGN